MKLKRFYIEEYQVLRDLSIEFSPYNTEISNYSLKTAYSLDFLVGKNGTGKSTVLQMLWDIMGQLEGTPHIEYPFELEYELEESVNNSHPSQIKIATIHQDPETGDTYFNPTPIAWKDGEEILIGRDILPKNIVAFTTGNEETWIKSSNLNDDNLDLDNLLNTSSEQRFLSEIPGHQLNNNALNQETEEAESRCFFISIKDLSLVILCGLLLHHRDTSEASPLKKALEATSIKNLTGFSLKFRLNQGIYQLHERETVINLAKLASYTIRQGSDYLCVFDITEQDNSIVQKILEQTKTFDELNLLKTLIKLTNVDKSKSILQEVNIFLERTSDSQHPETETELPPLHLLDWLSDGERSFLGRMCLLSLLKTTESLILLDEPEVHFNDFWKRQMVQLIDEVMKQSNSHLLITTHSSITLSDVPQKDIIILKRHGNQTMTAELPTVKTFAANPSDIMVHVFGASNPTGLYSIEFIKHKLNPSLYPNPDEYKLALEQLLSIVGQGYWSYRIERELSTLQS